MESIRTIFNNEPQPEEEGLLGAVRVLVPFKVLQEPSDIYLLFIPIIKILKYLFIVQSYYMIYI